MRVLILMTASLALGACSSWSVLNTEDMLAEAKARGVQTSAANAQAHWQEEMFGALAEFAGETFRGVPLKLAGDLDPSGVADIQSWAWRADGRELVIWHALEDGSYGGITHITPNGMENELAYRYVTSGGFETLGTFTLDEHDGWETTETVSGHETITQVRTRSHARDDGALITEAEYLTADGWQRGHSFVYTVFDGVVPEVVSPEG